MHAQPLSPVASALALLLVGLPLAAPIAGPIRLAALAGEYRQIPKQVTLIVEERRVVASNIRLGRIDPLLLQPDESVEQTAEAAAVLIVVTNQRLLGYGAVIGWHALAREAAEPVESLAVEDFAAFVTTGLRYLNFNAATGIWAAATRQ